MVFEEGINLQQHLQVNSTADITGAVTSGAITSSGVVTATGFTIGNAVINEAELETIDTITAGTVAASKAVVVDSDKDASGFRNITVTGSFIIGSADMNETDLEKFAAEKIISFDKIFSLLTYLVLTLSSILAFL